MPSNILKEHALKNIWAEPLQDMQHRVRPNRISPDFGFYGEALVMWERIPLPDYFSNDRSEGYHVYPIGQLPLGKFALEKLEKRKWYGCEEIVNTLFTTIDVYADNGGIVPRQNCFLYTARDNNIILAIKRNGLKLGTIIKPSIYEEELVTPYSLDNNNITVRFYTNALVDTDEWLNTAVKPYAPIGDYSAKIDRQQDFVNFMTRVDALIATYRQQGAGVFYQDGFVISRPVGFDASYSGSIFSFHYDSTIKDVRMFDLATSPGFQSILDKNTNKYILHPETSDGLLEYYDDCDFYLVRRDVNRKTYRGVAIDPFNGAGIKQLTHNTWSLSEDAVAALSAQHESLNGHRNLSVLAVVRQGGMVRGIGLQSNRVEELYHLPYALRLEALAGVNSLIPEWRAAELENSAYQQVMRSPLSAISSGLVEEAYGYNAATFAVAKSIYPVNADKTVTIDDGKSLPIDIRHNSQPTIPTQRSLFWYNAEGKLLGYTSEENSNKVIVVPTEFSLAKKVEVILGKVVEGVGDVGTIEDQEIVYDQSYGYFGHRNYVCNITNGQLDHRWVDVTDSMYCYYVKPEDGSMPYIRWNYNLLNAAGYYPATRFASKVAVHDVDFDPMSFNGVLTYQVNKITDGRLSLLGVQPGHFTVWLNGDSLVEGVDYYLGASNTIYIVKVPNTPIGNVRARVRFYGYQNPITNKPFSPRDVGFVKNGILSHNQKFNTWHDRDIRITVNGQLKLINEVSFAETGSEDTGNRYLDGMIYSVEDYQSPVEPFTDQNTIDYKMVSLDIDERIGDYLTPRLPEKDPEHEYVLTARRTLYSPIMSRFISLCLDGSISDEQITRVVDDSGILNTYKIIVDDYQQYDPIIQGFDENYVSVQPHPYSYFVEVTSAQYAFLERINRIFLKEKIDLTGFVQIKLN